MSTGWTNGQREPVIAPGRYFDGIAKESQPPAPFPVAPALVGVRNAGKGKIADRP